MTNLPVVIIGAGPVGLAAAAQLIQRGEQPIVVEAGASAGANVRAWGHVRLFSPWRYCVDEAAVALLEPTGWVMPDPEAHPTGGELYAQYLAPLAALPAIQASVRTQTQVLAVTRAGYDKLKSVGRETAPFLLHVAGPDGEALLEAWAVIDASGTYTQPNPLGAHGLPALGERALRDQITYRIPDVLGGERDQYAGQRILVVGSGHSAFNAVLDLAQLRRETPDTVVHWAVRRTSPGQMFGGGAADQLGERGALGQRAQHLVQAGGVQMHFGIRIAALHAGPDGIVVTSDDGRTLPPVDRIVATTGFRPDLDLLRELRLDLDPIVEAPATLAPLIDPNLHSCGSVPPHGANELAHPEANFYVVGMKSYGRAPTFLLLTGYEQVRSVVCALTGDVVGAREVRLVLPETGVCTSNLGDGADCCGPALVAPAAAARGLIDLAPVSNNGGCCR
jgi:thioredoxin reductase